MDTELVLDAADIHAPVAFVVDEHREATTVARPFFRAGEDEMQVRVAVGDETLHTVQAPAVVRLVVGSFQHDALEVGTGIRLGQVHRHRFAGADTRDEAAVLILVAKFVQGLDTILQRPDVTEARIGSSDDFGTHRVRSNREIQTTEAARHRHAIQSGLHHRVEVSLRARSIFHAAVGAVRTFLVHTLGVGSNDIGGNFARYFQYFVV